MGGRILPIKKLSCGRSSFSMSCSADLRWPALQSAAVLGEVLFDETIAGNISDPSWGLAPCLRPVEFGYEPPWFHCSLGRRLDRQRLRAGRTGCARTSILLRRAGWAADAGSRQAGW
jgi:hypothetical protein